MRERFNEFAKRSSKLLSRPLLLPGLQKLPSAAELYLAFLQGKGAGMGWDIAEEVRAAEQFITSPQPVIFDVGASNGIWTRALLERVPEAEVYLVEPSPHCRDALVGLGEHLPVALGARVEERVLFSADQIDGSASLYSRRDSYLEGRVYNEYPVQVATLDDLMAQYEVAHIDFMKMDIEGHELAALQGGANALREQRIGALSFEFGAGNLNSRTYFYDFWELLTGYGYQIERITPAGRLLPITRYYEDLEYFRGVSNYIAHV